MTYAQSRERLFQHLRGLGWTLKTGLKVPQAITPRGSIVRFKAQAVYVGEHSLWIDIREISPQQFVEAVMERESGRDPNYDARERTRRFEHAFDLARRHVREGDYAKAIDLLERNARLYRGARRLRLLREARDLRVRTGWWASARDPGQRRASRKTRGRHSKARIRKAIARRRDPARRPAPRKLRFDDLREGDVFHFVSERGVYSKAAGGRLSWQGARGPWVKISSTRYLALSSEGLTGKDDRNIHKVGSVTTKVTRTGSLSRTWLRGPQPSRDKRR